MVRLDNSHWSVVLPINNPLSVAQVDERACWQFVTSSFRTLTSADIKVIMTKSTLLCNKANCRDDKRPKFYCGQYQ